MTRGERKRRPEVGGMRRSAGVLVPALALIFVPLGCSESPTEEVLGVVAIEPQFFVSPACNGNSDVCAEVVSPSTDGSIAVSNPWTYTINVTAEFEADFDFASQHKWKREIEWRPYGAGSWTNLYTLETQPSGYYHDSYTKAESFTPGSPGVYEVKARSIITHVLYGEIHYATHYRYITLGDDGGPTGSIEGPTYPDEETQIPPGAYCTYNAAPSGGTPPYTYSWSGLATSSNSSVSFGPSSSGWLYLRITDFTSQYVDLSHYIRVDSGYSAPGSCTE